MSQYTVPWCEDVSEAWEGSCWASDCAEELSRSRRTPPGGLGETYCCREQLRWRGRRDYGNCMTLSVTPNRADSPACKQLRLGCTLYANQNH